MPNLPSAQTKHAIYIFRCAQKSVLILLLPLFFPFIAPAFWLFFFQLLQALWINSLNQSFLPSALAPRKKKKKKTPSHQSNKNISLVLFFLEL